MSALLVVTSLVAGCTRSTGRIAAPAPSITSSGTPPARQQTAVPSPRTQPPPTIVVVAGAGTPGVYVLSEGRVRPDTVATQAGRSVRWHNDDAVPHHVVSVEAGLFDSGEIAPGQDAVLFISERGDHDWYDLTDGRLRGTLRVLP